MRKILMTFGVICFLLYGYVLFGAGAPSTYNVSGGSMHITSISIGGNNYEAFLYFPAPYVGPIVLDLVAVVPTEFDANCSWEGDYGVCEDMVTDWGIYDVELWPHHDKIWARFSD